MTTLVKAKATARASKTFIAQASLMIVKILLLYKPQDSFKVRNFIVVSYTILVQWKKECIMMKRYSLQKECVN